MPERIKFKINGQKGLEVLAWLANRHPGITRYYVAKVIFYADKKHLERFGRPVIGDTYYKMEEGPVPSWVYDVLKMNKRKFGPNFLQSIASAIDVGGGQSLELRPVREPNLKLISKTDLKCLEEAYRECINVPFDELKSKTHEEPAWIEAEPDKPMDYELIISSDHPHKELILRKLRETAPIMVL